MENNGEYMLTGSIAVDGEGVLRSPLPEVNSIDINLSQLKRNYQIIRRLLLPEVKLLVILKGNAYGHGLIPVARELERYSCEAFGVVRLNEAYAIRTAKVKTKILLLAPFLPSQARELIRNDITPMVDQEDALRALEEACKEYNQRISVHVKVNTGLNRFGIAPEEAVSFLAKIKSEFPHLKVEGIYTHFQDPDYNPEMTRKQLLLFQKTLTELESSGLKPSIVHAAGSAAILDYPETHFNMVRCGIIMFGLEHTMNEKNLPEGIATLMTLKGRILRIRMLRTGEYGGYGNRFIAAKETRIAVIALGYGDGISRGWKEVLIAGHRAPVLNYFMDGLLVDISDIKEPVTEYDEAVLLGRQGAEAIGWGEVCRVLGTYEDEQVQYITERVPKNYFYETAESN